MEPVDLTAALSVPALAVSAGILFWVRKGDADARRQTVVIVMLLGDLALTLAGVSATWPPLFEFAAPLALCCALAGIFVASERPDGARAREARWTSFEQQFDAYSRTSNTASEDS